MSIKSSSARGYGSSWQKAREGFLRKNPVCAMHLKFGKVVKATVVDHVIPHKGDMKLFWASENWQALCKLCHDSHKKRLEISGREVGCDVHGIPIDANHHWNKGNT